MGHHNKNRHNDMLIPQQETLSVLCNKVDRNNDVRVSALEISQKEFKLLTYHKKIQYLNIVHP